MSEAYDGNDEGWDWWDWESGGGSGGAPAPSGGGTAGPPGGGMPTGGYGGAGGDGMGGYTPTQTGGQSFSNPFGSGIDYFNTPTTGRTGGLETGGGNPTTGTPSIPPGGISNSTQNNTQNNSNVLAQSVGLGAVSPISSGVPQSPASSFRPNVISSGGGLREGAPPPMPAPHAPEPPTLHPEKPTDWSKITFGAASSAPQSNPAGQRSTLGKIGGAIGQITGLGQAAQRYKGLYDSMHGQKAKTPEEEQADAYRATYGL